MNQPYQGSGHFGEGQPRLDAYGLLLCLEVQYVAEPDVHRGHFLYSRHYEFVWSLTSQSDASYCAWLRKRPRARDIFVGPPCYHLPLIRTCLVSDFHADKKTRRQRPLALHPSPRQMVSHKPTSPLHNSQYNVLVGLRTPVKMPRPSPAKSPRVQDSAASPVVVGVHPVPRPEDLQGPREGQHIQGFYLVTIGRECGIFFSW